MKKGWTYKKLGECSYVQNGFAFNSKLFNSSNVGTPLVRIRDIKRGFSKTYTTESCEKEYTIENGDILIGMDGDFNVCIWNGGFSYLNQRVCHVVPSNEILSRFLYYYLPFPLNKINEKTSYSTVKHLSSKQIYNIITPVPPLSEQQQIVDRLDSAFAKIDAVKANAEKQLNDAKALFQKELSKAMMPKDGWEYSTLIEVFNFIDYRGATPYKLQSGVPLVTAKNVKFGYIDYTIKDYISREEFENRKGRGVSHKGDILFTTEAPLGNVAIADLDEFSAGQRLITFQQYRDSKFNVINRYYYYYMLGPVFQEKIKSLATGATAQGIKAKLLKTVTVPIPPLSVQQAIVTRLDTLSEKLKTVEEKQKAIMAECDAMKQALLREVFA